MAFIANDIHPMRFLGRFPEGRSIARRAAQHIRSGLLDSTAFDKLVEDCIAAYNRALSRLTLDERPENGDVLNSIISTLAHISAFIAGGKNIITIPPNIVTMLAHTELGDIRLSDMHLPFSNFYIAFTGGLGVGFPGPMNVIDGAYVENFNRSSPTEKATSISFYLTSRRTSVHHRGATAWIAGHEPHFFAPLEFNDGHTLDGAIQDAVAKSNIELNPNLESIAELKRGVNDAQEKGFFVQSPTITGYERAALYNNGAFKSVKNVIAIICNSLCLLSTKPDLSDPNWPVEAPKSLIEDASKASTLKRRRTAIGRLAEEGFFPVRHILISSEVNKKIVDAKQIGVRTFNEVAPHWRRGHWRRQAFGSALSERRLLWIRPVLVNQCRGEPVASHVYHVGE